MSLELIPAAVVRLEDEEGRILLLRRSTRDRSFPDRWCLPGGRVDPGESPRVSVRRELEEETGLRCGALHEGPVIDRPQPERSRVYRIHSFRALLPIPPAVTLSHEHSEARWLRPGEALALPLAGSATRALIEGA